MPRYKLIVEYDGGGLVGWQSQTSGMSVQQTLEEAAFKFTGERPVVHGAGRTDAGVHALAQVAHLDFTKDFEPDRVRDAMNAHMRKFPVVVIKAERAAPDFHARFSATWRSYIYRIVNRRANLALDRGRAWWIPNPLDVEAMNEAAQVLIGKHDFSSFRASECQAKSPIKTLDILQVTKAGSEIRIFVKARSFLHHMVRNITGTLRLVGEGKWNAEDVRLVLEQKDRRAAGPTAPACGLYLAGVGYDGDSAASIEEDDDSVG